MVNKENMKKYNYGLIVLRLKLRLTFGIGNSHRETFGDALLEFIYVCSVSKNRITKPVPLNRTQRCLIGSN